MFYDNGSYMQDLNYFNQNPIMNQNFGYNPYMMNNFQNQNPTEMQNQQNINAMYPACYRIIYPVALQIVNNSNIQYLTEEGLNSMVDKVYNIVEGDISLNDSNSFQEPTQVSNNRNQNSNSNANVVSKDYEKCNKRNDLLKDLIKVIILNQIISKKRNQARMIQNYNMNQMMF